MKAGGFQSGTGRDFMNVSKSWENCLRSALGPEESAPDGWIIHCSKNWGLNHMILLQVLSSPPALEPSPGSDVRNAVSRIPKKVLTATV